MQSKIIIYYFYICDLIDCVIGHPTNLFHNNIIYQNRVEEILYGKSLAKILKNFDV